MTEEKTTPVVEENKAAKAATPAPTDAKPGGRPQRDAKGGRKGGQRRRNSEPKEFEEAIIDVGRVTRVTKGGRQMRFRVAVVIGDKKGRVGFGIGKSIEVMVGAQKAITFAKRDLLNVPIFEDTIPHAVEAHFKATKVTLLPAQDGKGLIAGGAVRKVLELAGIKNVMAKIHGSRNAVNVVHATLKALRDLENKAPRGAKKAAVEEAPKAETTEASKKAPAKKVAPKKPAAKKEETK